MPELNRRGRRSQMEATGKVLLGLFRKVPCTVSDISNSGARISVGADQTLPETFWLKVSGYRRKMKAETRWRKGDEVGVEFTLD